MFDFGLGSASLAGGRLIPQDLYERAVKALGHEGVTDTVIAMIDVEKEPAKIKDTKFRMRKLTIAPGATVPAPPTSRLPAIDPVPPSVPAWSGQWRTRLRVPEAMDRPRI